MATDFFGDPSIWNLVTLIYKKIVHSLLVEGTDGWILISWSIVRYEDASFLPQNSVEVATEKCTQVTTRNDDVVFLQIIFWLGSLLTEKTSEGVL